MVILSPLLYLRFFKDDDARFLLKLLSDPLVTQHLPDEDHLSSLGQAQRVLQKMISDTLFRERFCQALIYLPTHSVIGALIANNYNMEDKSAYIAYELDPRYWNKGFMTEGLKYFLPFVQNVFSLKTIKAQTTHDNYRSQRLLEKQGFEKEKMFDFMKPINGKFVRAHLYALDTSKLKKI